MQNAEFVKTSARRNLSQFYELKNNDVIDVFGSFTIESGSFILESEPTWNELIISSSAVLSLPSILTFVITALSF